MRHTLKFGLSLLCMMLLVGCGQKGPLYLPSDERSTEQYDPAGAHQADPDQQPNSDAASASSDDEG